MGKVNAALLAFNVGEVSRAGMARVDLQRTRLAAETQENLVPAVSGKMQLRPGLEFIAETTSSFRTKLFPFFKTTDDKALLVLRDAQLRIIIDDEYLARDVVTSSITNGAFNSATGWTTATTADAVCDINSTVSGALYMYCPARGSEATCVGSATTSNVGDEHGLRITVTRGPVLFRCGTTSGGDDLIQETTLETGDHSLSFSPTSATYYVHFRSRRNVAVIVDRIIVESDGDVSINGPWSVSEFRAIRVAQSLDEVFMANYNWRTMKAQRNNNARSWSLVEYRSDDGPFQLAASADLTLTPGATYGNTTLTASRDFFKEAHVGCLFRLFHERTDITIAIGAVGESTEAVRHSGVGAENDSVITISGTWVGTLSLQRSYVGPDEGFVDTGTTYTTNGSTTYAPGAQLDNVVHWIRLTMTAYTSGAAYVTNTYGGDAGAGICRVTSYTSATEVDIEVLKPFRNVIGTKDWRQGAWSSISGWPSAVAFVDGRVGFLRNDKWWLSESDGYYNFDLDTEGDSASIQRSIATGGGASNGQWMMSLQRLLVGTTDQVASIRSSALNEEITATSTTVRDCATIGVASANPIKVDNRGMFIDVSRSKVYELSIAGDTGDYIASEVTDLNEDIGEGGTLLDLAVQRQPDTYIWHVRSDGQAPVLVYEPKQEVAGYFRVVTDGASGQIEDVCVLRAAAQDAVYFVVRREVNGVARRFIEKLALMSEARGGSWNKMADSFVTSAGPVSSVTASHLANTDGLIGWGTDADGNPAVLTGLSANSLGGVALGGTYTNVCVGLPYRGRYKSAKLAYGAQGGTALLQTKRISRIGLLLSDTHKDALSIGDSFDDMYDMPRIENGTAISEPIHAIYDEAAFTLGSRWDTDARVCIEVNAPYPATLLGMVLNVETNEDV